VSTVHVVVPAGIDDQAQPSGGNVYDRRICSGLAALGWTVVEHHVLGSWPWPDARAEEALALRVACIPDAAVVLVDGLIASTAPAVLVPQARRLRLVVLVHMSLAAGPAAQGLADARTREGAVLAAAVRVVTTSMWTRQQLVAAYGLPADSILLAQPGVDAAALAERTPGGGALLCVAAVARHKGQDVLLGALAALPDLPWHCVCVGSLDTDPAFVDQLRHRVQAAGISHRVIFTGPRCGDLLDQSYQAADLLVLASRAEAYGMVVAEALAQGLPVVASAVGGVPEALGRTLDGRIPGLLVPPGDRSSLTRALGRWLLEPDLREHLRQAARDRRTALVRWSDTSERVAHALTEAAA
jgi:glycosyltransferase involved in cell wall biosynthesis